MINFKNELTLSLKDITCITINTNLEDTEDGKSQIAIDINNTEDYEYFVITDDNVKALKIFLDELLAKSKKGKKS